MYNLRNTCYLCLTYSENLSSIYEGKKEELFKIKHVIPELLLFGPQVPHCICIACQSTLTSFYVFKRKCLGNNYLIMQCVKKRVHQQQEQQHTQNAPTLQTTQQQYQHPSQQQINNAPKPQAPQQQQQMNNDRMLQDKQQQRTQQQPLQQINNDRMLQNAQQRLQQLNNSPKPQGTQQEQQQMNNTVLPQATQKHQQQMNNDRMLQATQQQQQMNHERMLRNKQQQHCQQQQTNNVPGLQRSQQQTLQQINNEQDTQQRLAPQDHRQQQINIDRILQATQQQNHQQQHVNYDPRLPRIHQQLLQKNDNELLLQNTQQRLEQGNNNPKSQGIQQQQISNTVFSQATQDHRQQQMNNDRMLLNAQQQFRQINDSSKSQGIQQQQMNNTVFSQVSPNHRQQVITTMFQNTQQQHRQPQLNNTPMLQAAQHHQQQMNNIPILQVTQQMQNAPMSKATLHYQQTNNAHISKSVQQQHITNHLLQVLKESQQHQPTKNSRKLQVKQQHINNTPILHDIQQQQMYHALMSPNTQQRHNQQRQMNEDAFLQSAFQQQQQRQVNFALSNVGKEQQHRQQKNNFPVLQTTKQKQQIQMSSALMLQQQQQQRNNVHILQTTQQHTPISAESPREILTNLHRTTATLIPNYEKDIERNIIIIDDDTGSCDYSVKGNNVQMTDNKKYIERRNSDSDSSNLQVQDSSLSSEHSQKKLYNDDNNVTNPQNNITTGTPDSIAENKSINLESNSSVSSSENKQEQQNSFVFYNDLKHNSEERRFKEIENSIPLFPTSNIDIKQNNSNHLSQKQQSTESNKIDVLFMDLESKLEQMHTNSQLCGQQQNSEEKNMKRKRLGESIENELKHPKPNVEVQALVSKIQVKENFCDEQLTTGQKEIERIQERVFQNELKYPNPNNEIATLRSKEEQSFADIIDLTGNVQDVLVKHVQCSKQEIEDSAFESTLQFKEVHEQSFAGIINRIGNDQSNIKSIASKDVLESDVGYSKRGVEDLTLQKQEEKQFLGDNIDVKENCLLISGQLSTEQKFVKGKKLETIFQNELRTLKGEIEEVTSDRGIKTEIEDLNLEIEEKQFLAEDIDIKENFVSVFDIGQSNIQGNMKIKSFQFENVAPHSQEKSEHKPEPLYDRSYAEYNDLSFSTLKIVAKDNNTSIRSSCYSYCGKIEDTSLKTEEKQFLAEDIDIKENFVPGYENRQRNSLENIKIKSFQLENEETYSQRLRIEQNVLSVSNPNMEVIKGTAFYSSTNNKFYQESLNNIYSESVVNSSIVPVSSPEDVDVKRKFVSALEKGQTTNQKNNEIVSLQLRNEEDTQENSEDKSVPLHDRLSAEQNGLSVSNAHIEDIDIKDTPFDTSKDNKYYQESLNNINSESIVNSSRTTLSSCESNTQINISNTDFTSTGQQIYVDMITAPETFNEIKGTLKAKCDICNMVLLRASMRRHYRRTHQIKHMPLPKSTQSYKCAICKKIFKRLNAFKKHRKIHNNSLLKCELCKKVYTCEKYFREHQKTHTTEYKYECELCKKRFHFEYRLKYHIITKHNTQKKYECSICNRKFTHIIYLNQHIKSHDRSYECKDCNKKFVRQGNLVQHRKTHIGVKNFKCSTCNMKFLLNTHLKQHEKTHLGKRDFKCSICSKAFLHNGSLRKHMEIHNNKII